MEFRILCVGDVVGQIGVEYLEQTLWKYRTQKRADMVIVNGENAAVGNGLDAGSAQRLLDCGADVLTSGNHIWQKKDIRVFLDEHSELLRPANYPDSCPGTGYGIFRINGYRVLVFNLMGTVYLEPLADPFVTADRILNRMAGQYDFAVLDLHAEATSEKIAMGYFLDGRVAAVFGTHTHVQTADERILPRGTGYMTDLGMTGPDESVLGVAVSCVLEKFTTRMPVRFETADGHVTAHGVLLTVDPETGKCVAIERLTF